MSNIHCDPVISVYLQMLDTTQSDLQLPEYSEIYLRLALKENCGKNFALSADVLQLYRKLLVLYYCELYPSLTPVVTIMERCFIKDEIYNIINEKNYLLGRWLEFQNNYITEGATKETQNIFSLEEITLNKKIKLGNL